MRLGRRSFLRLGAFSAAGLSLPACIEDALRYPAHSCSKSIRDVEHVVILLQENRAFDHYFGTYAGVRGFGDRFTIPLAGQPTIWHQRSGSEVILPYHLDETRGNAQRVAGTPHSLFDAMQAYDHGRYGRWPAWKFPQSMGHYQRQELPFQFALAEAFTLCDAYFCGVHSSTLPNRFVAFTGTIDPLGRDGGPAIDNSHEALGPVDEGYRWVTYAERLERAGVSWKVYQDAADNFGDNPLVGFRSFRDAYLNHPSSPLVTKGISTTLTTPSLDGLRADVVGGRLPSVSWIVGPAEYSEHPGPSSPAQGAAYVQQVLEALLADPEVWSRTVLLVTFDENDGFFDHVPPPCAPSRNVDGVLMGKSSVDDTGERYLDGEGEFLSGRPLGPGVRVPMWVVSPFSRGGWVCSETFDHTSILRFLESRFGVSEPNISPYRRAFCGDLCSAFDFVNPNLDAVPALAGYSLAEADALRSAQESLAPVPRPDPATASLPVQATGVRPSRALPYDLRLQARASLVDGTLGISFTSVGGVGAVFHVYDRLDLTEIPRRYAVAHGHTVTDDLPTSAGRYDLFVLGPNGFHRALRGRVADDAARAEVDARYDPEGERLILRLHNQGRTALSFVLTPRAPSSDPPSSHPVPAGRSVDVVVDAAPSGRWYDVEVTIEGDADFGRRFAGRIENGLPSVTDPAMGMA